MKVLIFSLVGGAVVFAIIAVPAAIAIAATIATKEKGKNEKQL